MERLTTPYADGYCDPLEVEVLEHYEINRERHKDERDGIQKKTFTKWVNKHLAKAECKVNDLFVDLRDGFSLIALLEVLTGDRLPRENGYTRFHRIQNVQYCLDFLRKKNIKLVNIRPEDIVEGNGKLTLGLIWTIILNFQVSVIKRRQLEESLQQSTLSNSSQVSESLHASDASSARDALLQWARKVTSGYPRVNVTNFSSSWKDGLAFNAILHRYRPNLIDWNKVSDSSVSNRERLENAFAAAEREFGVDRLLDAQDVDTDHPDEKSIITYVSSLYNALPHLPELSKFITMQEQYIVEARAWMELVERATTLIDNETLFMQSSSSQQSESLSEFEKYRSESMATRAREYDRLMERYEVLRRHLSGTDHFCIPRNLTEQALTEAWSNLTYLNDHKLASIHQKIIQSNLSDLISRLSRGIGITNEKLDLILNRIEEVESRVDTARPGEIERTVNEIVDDLNALEPPIGGFFDDVEELKSQNHPEANDFYRQVYGLHQRRTAYLDRLTNQLLVRLGVRTETLRKENASRLESIRTSSFNRVQECIEWVRVRLEKLSEMEFLEDLETLEEMFEQHKLDNRDIQDFRQNVDECIARQAEVSAEDTYEYCELLRVLESEYQQLRDLSAGRMLDLDSLIAFVRAAQMELVWVSEREEIEVTRNWSDVKQLDLPMLTNYYKQLLHEMELREKQYNDVHNQGAALLNQGHPAVHVIEVYLRTMQNQWDWLLALSKCLEEHLRDALNLKSFTEEAADAEAWMEEQAIRLENNYNRTDFDLEEGERLLRELDEMKEILNKYHSVLMALTERCATISPLWQRGERISRPIAVTALCDYSDKNVHIKAGDEVVLLDNSDLIKWHIRDLAGSEGTVPSVVFRIPPPDPKLTGYLNRLLQQFEKLKKLWEKKHRMVRFNMVLNTMKTIQGWDLDTFNAIDPEQRDAIMRALNDDANKLLAEMDPNDPLALRLKEELRRTNEHFWDLLNASQKPPEPDHSNLFDGQIGDLLRKLEEAWRKLNDNTGKPISRSPEELENVIMNHKSFEDALQGLDADVANVKELFRQLPNPTPTQRVNNDRLSTLWEDLWDLSRMYVERIKVLESVLNGILEVSDIVKAHEITLNSFDDLPAALDKLRGHHSQLLEMNMVLQQQQSVIDSLNKNVALLRQHVARTRIGQSSHPDVDRLEDEVQQLNVRWENVCAQVADRLKAAERALQTQMVYRSEYESEMSWLDRVEETINKLRKPEELRPEQYQQQLDILVAEYAQLQERTEAIENVNREGGKFIREAKGYDSRMGQFHDSIVGIHGPAIKQEFRRTKPQPKNGAQIVTEELEALNRRFAQLSSLILERRNTMQVLIQNWKRQKQESVAREATIRQNELSQIISELARFQETIYSQHLSFDLTPETASNAHNDVQALKDSLDKWRREVKEKLEAVDTLCFEAGDSISPEQHALLRERRNQLTIDYDNVIREVENLHGRLNVLASLLIEFSSKASTLQSWMTHQTRAIGLIRERSAEPLNLSEARQDARRLLDEITQEESQLRSLGSLLAKIEQEVDGLYDSAPVTITRGIHSTEIRNTFHRVDDDFSALKRHCSDLIQFQNKIAGLGSEHAENLRRMEDWFSKIEGDLDQVERRSDRDVEQKLVILEGLNQEAVDGNMYIDYADQTSRRLLNALDGLSAHPDASSKHELESEERRKRHSRLLDRMQQAFNKATAEKAANEGVRDAVLELCSWIENYEGRSCTDRDIPLIEEDLNQLKRDEQMLRMDLDSRLSLTHDLDNDLKKLAGANSPAWVEPTEQKLKNAILRLQRNSTELRGFRDNVNDALEGVIALDAIGAALDRSCDATLATLRSTSARDHQSLNEIASELAVLDSQLTEMMRTADTIKKIPNVTKTEGVDRLVRSADEKLHNLAKELDSKYSTQEEVGRLESDFEQAKQRMAEWTSNFDAELLELKPVSIDHERLTEQRKEQLALAEKHKEGLARLEDLEAVSMRLVEAERESGGNRLSATPRIAMELVAKYNAQADALRSRAERINTADQKAIELLAAEDELSSWISSQTKTLTDYDVPTSIDAVNALLATLDRMSKAKRQEQRRLDDIRLRGRELAADARSVGEGERLLERHQLLSEKWDQLTDLMEATRERVSVAEKWIEGHAALEKWLGSKRRMLLAIGAPTTDAAIAKSQMGQIQIISAEMDGERASYKKLKEMLESLPGASSTGLAPMMNELNSGWASFEKELTDKERNVQRASDLGAEIKSMQKAVMNDVAVLESDIEKFGALLPSEVEARLGELSAFKSQLVDLSEQVDHMSQLIDPSSDLEIDSMNKGDLDEQMNNMRKKIDEMNRKLDQLKNVAVSSRSEGDEIEKKLEVLLDVAREARSEIEEAPPISAERNRLQEHLDSINDLLVKISDLEGDFPYVRAMVTERLKKVPDDELQLKMQYLANNWNPTVTNVKDKKAMISKVLDLVKQFEGLEKTLRDNLTQDENELAAVLANEDGTAVQNALKSMENVSGRRMADAHSLNALATRINASAPGPEANKFLRSAENFVNDCGALSKRINLATEAAQRKVDLAEKFNRLAEEARHVVDGERQALNSGAAEVNSVERVVAKLAEINGFWNRSQRELSVCADELKKTVTPSKAEAIDHTMVQLDEDFASLRNELQGLEAALSAKKEDLEKLSEMSSSVKNDVNAMYMELSDLDPVARNIAELHAQQDQVKAIEQRLEASEARLQSVLAEWNKGVAAGVISQPQMENNQALADDVTKMIEKARKKLGQREKKIEEAIREVEAVHKNAAELIGELNGLRDSEALSAVVTVSDPTAQAEKLKTLKDNLKAVGARVDDFVAECKLLIRTGGPEADTAELDNMMKDVCDMWSVVSTTVAEKEREADSAVQQLGRYEDAYKSLLNWIEETEELMENQRPPAADARVARAQLHAYDVLMKHIDDKDFSVKGFSALIAKLIAMTTVEEEAKSLKERDEEINKRYNELVAAAHDRQRRLIEAVDLAERLSEGVIPVESWLAKAEKRLNALGKVPTNVEKMEEQLKEQKDLDDEVYQKAEDVDHALAIVPMLSALVSVEDANSLESQANQITSRYESIAHRVRITRDLLQEMALTVNDLFADLDSLEVWLGDMEQKMDEISEIAIAPDDLTEQSNIVGDLVTAITERDAEISAVMEVGRQLCRQSTGDEAVPLQYRMDQLKKRYGDIMLVADEKLQLLAKAIPLSERFHEGFEAVMEWVEAVEEDLIQIDTADLDTQTQLVFSMEEGVSHWRPEVDDLVAVSSQLQALSSPDQAEELFQSTAEMNRRVNQIADKVARRAERLDVADRQSRAVFDELSFLLEWLGYARDRVVAAGPPSIDPDFARTQLRNQLVMNDDVAANKGRLREITVEAKKVCRELGGEGGESSTALAEQCDHAKELVDEVTALCMDRTEILERALALSQHLTVEFDRLANWLDQVDDELRSAPDLTTATPPHQLRKQREHNAELSAAILTYVPIVEQFKSDVKALQEICVPEDGVKLGELADEIVAKYGDMRKAVEARGQALDSIVDATSGLGERLENFVQTLQGASDRLRQNTSVSSDPTLLKTQIAENLALREGLKSKQAAYAALQESAAELLASLPPEDSARQEVNEKLRRLADLWKSIEQEAEDRGGFLESILAKANHFWNELDECQRAIDDLRMRLESVEPAAGQPEQLQRQQVEMQTVASSMATTENRLVGLREAGVALSGIVPAEEQTVINAQVDAVHDGWATITKLFADKNRDLVVAMEDAMAFHADLSNLLNWLDVAEKRLALLPAAESVKVDEIPRVLEEVHAFKDEMDSQAVLKEQLCYTASQIASGAPIHQAAAIRQPINKLNLRWTQLYSALCDRENKVERMLLQMGRLSEAVEQLITWMRKTRGTLNELSVAAPALRQLEIQRCQLIVVSNDIHAHESSVSTLNAAAQRLLRDDRNTDVLDRMNEMNKEWRELNEILEALTIQMERAKADAEKVGRETEQWMAWLEDVESQLATTKPTGGLPETAEVQMDDFLVLRAEIAQNKPLIEKYIHDADVALENADANAQTWMARNHALIKNKWSKVKELCADREKKLQLALEEAVALDSSMRDTAEWLAAAEQRLAAVAPISRLVDVLEKQLMENEKWVDEVAVRKQLMAEQQAAGTRLQYYCEKKDAIPIKNGLVSLKHRFEKVASRTADRTKQLNAALDEARVWMNGVDDLKLWLEDIGLKISNEQLPTGNVNVLKQQHNDIKKIQSELAARQQSFDTTYKRGRSLIDHAPRAEGKQINEMNEGFKKLWNSVLEKANQRRIAVEQALLDSSAFDDAVLELESWIDAELAKNAAASDRVLGDIDTVRVLTDEHKKRETERVSKQRALDTIVAKANKLSTNNVDESDNITNACDRVKQKWSQLEEESRARMASLEDALARATDFDTKVHEILDWLVEIEGRLAVSSSDLRQALTRVEDIKVELSNARDNRDACLEAGRALQAKCHPRAEQPLKHWLRVVENRWKDVEERASEREFSLLDQQQQEKEREQALFELLEFVAHKREELNRMLAQALPQDLESMRKAQRTYEEFDFELREKQADVDNAVKLNKKGKSNAAAVKLSDEWKQLWLDSIGHQTALEGQRQLLEEMRRLEGWRWEQWKEQYVEWNDHRKARVSDLFRRYDRSHTGNIPRDVFIDAVLASKFPTSRLEMNKVADLFDKGDGLINSKEFIDALRFDRSRELKPMTDHEKVNEEITKQKNACSCCQQYKIEKVADGHYRFGDTQIKRMVRILRSTVMVRVGGGWEALDEFLSKHDPCRAKGRLNIDMFYKDVTPSTAIDTMRAFTKGRHRSSSHHTVHGPIMKIREKTERSIPMFPHRRDQGDNDMETSSRGLLTTSRDSLATPTSRSHSRASDSTADEKPTRIPSLRIQKGGRSSTPRS
ncbi:hypothetical protein V3C99_004485 [Haemonchus contortus]